MYVGTRIARPRKRGEFMRKILAAIFTLSMLFVLAACGGVSQDEYDGLMRELEENRRLETYNDMCNNGIYNTTPERFYRQHRNVATLLFAQVEVFDPEDDTLSAREVIELFMATKHLLYGNMIICEDVRETTFFAHRALMSSERTDNISAGEQFITLMHDIAFLLDQEERMSGFRINAVDYDQFFPERYAVARVRGDLLSVSYYWRYHLINENGRWRIYAWEVFTV